MDVSLLLLVSSLSFGLSFIFAMGGIGSALVLVPILHWLGFPLNEAKPTCLFINTLSMTGASISNIKHKRLDFRLGIPIIISSTLLAPAGAYVSTLISTRTVLIIFTLFLIFSGNMMLFFKSSKYKDQFREDRPLLPMIGIGSTAGFISGLLGVGGGALISPLMIILGFNPKKVAAITAFVVPFSSLTGFIAYWAMGHVNPLLVLLVGFAAYIGGYLGTQFMQKKLKPATVKRFLALVILLLALKMITRLI
jgi:hypothetical protein